MMKDLAYVNIVCALYELADKQQECEGIIRVDVDDKMEEKINYCMRKIKRRLDYMLHKHRDLREYVIPLSNELLQVANDAGFETIQPDYLGTYILRFRFIRTNRKVHDDFLWITNQGSTMLRLMDLLDETKVSDRDDEMCELAYSIANSL